MKSLIKNIVLPALLVLFTFTSCQEEIDVVSSDNPSEEVIEASSVTAQLITQTSANDGSSDNIIDGASCINVVFPVTVNVNGLEITIDSEMDLEVIEEIFDRFEDDEDILEIIFPITIVSGDFTEVTINNKEELQTFVDECVEGGGDEDIECIDFQYPLTFFTFDAENERTGTVVVENDRQLHRFFRSLGENDIVSVQYPVTLILFDGNEIVVNSNQELAAALESARDLCDEDDDDDFNDDDFTKERLDALLVECPWLIRDFRRNDVDNTDQYRDFRLNFSEDGSVVVRTRNGDQVTGTWATRVTDNGALLRMEFETFVDFNLEWFIYDISNGRIKLFTEGGNRIILRQNCEDDISEERARAFLQECFWRVARLQIDGSDMEDQYIGTPLKFEDDNVVRLRVNGQFVQGTWDVLDTQLGFVLQITFDNRPELNLFWLVIVLEEDRIALVNENSELVLRRVCLDQQDGDVVEIRSILNDGEWTVALYSDSGEDVTSEFNGFVIDFLENGGVLAEGNGQLIDGSWLVRRDDGILKLGLNFGLEPPFDELNNVWKIVEVDGSRIELRDINEDNNSESVLVFEKI
ncbi:hypothetical protein GTQ40_15575 [Flavobacteriaceae bacterium R38]|nr:hypothetical protein [Flavobacteriaceae bacterium R38]